MKSPLGRLLCNRLSANGIDPLVVPAIALNVAQIQKTQTEAPVAFVCCQTFQPIGDLFVLVTQFGTVSVAGLADLERTARERDAYAVPCNRIHGHLSPSTLSSILRIDCRAMDGLSAFFQAPPSADRFACSSQHTCASDGGSLRPYPSSRISTTHPLSGHRDAIPCRAMHAAKLGPPFIETCAAPSRTLLRNILPVSASRAHGKAQKPARRPLLASGSSLPAACCACACRAMHDLRVAVSSVLHRKSPQSSCRENSTFEHQ